MILKSSYFDLRLIGNCLTFPVLRTEWVSNPRDRVPYQLTPRNVGLATLFRLPHRTANIKLVFNSKNVAKPSLWTGKFM